MYLDSAKKEEIFGKYGKSKADTGSAESQIALFTYRISHLTEHMKKNKKDFNTSRALKMLVGKRRRLLDYLMKIDIERYRAIIKELGIRSNPDIRTPRIKKQLSFCGQLLFRYNLL